MSKQKVFHPNKDFSDHALIRNISQYQYICKQAEDEFEGFWKLLADTKLHWIKPYEEVLNESDAPFYKWFTHGKLNVSYQCIDRHLKKRKNKAAILFEGELGDKQVLTYQDLYNRVNRLANLLKNKFDIKKGDRVIIYLPMIPELPVAMLACARIGAIHIVVFGGFSSDALRDRISDTEAKLVITADGGFRKGKPHMLKPVVDEALKDGCETIKSVLVVERNKEKIDLVDGRDFLYNDLVNKESITCKPEVMDSEDPLFILHTSGSTGKPKGVLHSQAGYILWAILTMEWVFEVKENDTYWCTADIGWITGHTYIVYGPLAIGATTVIYEGVPVYPNPGRWWKMIEEYQVNQFYTAPTAIRLLNQCGKDEPQKYDLSSLKILGTVGEPINTDAWMWYHNAIGNQKCPIVDTWWQTETGGHMISPLPGATPTKPGSATYPLPGIFAEITDENGIEKKPNEKGLLCITKPWPGMIRTIWNDPEKYVQNYFSTVKRNGKPIYFSGDSAVYDDDGYIWITGRVDDVLNVSGHRIGTAEVESAIGHHSNVAEVAVVSKPHDLKGESIFVYIVLQQEDENLDQTKNEINDLITKEIGPFAKADTIIAVPGLPKTRSGKIMRRILRSLAKSEEITQDISTLEDPAVVEKIKTVMQ